MCAQQWASKICEVAMLQEESYKMNLELLCPQMDIYHSGEKYRETRIST